MDNINLTIINWMIEERELFLKVNEKNTARSESGLCFGRKTIGRAAGNRKEIANDGTIAGT
jgi:hypothetical protein